MTANIPEKLLASAVRAVKFIERLKWIQGQNKQKT
jgi:hypothetical protein